MQWKSTAMCVSDASPGGLDPDNNNGGRSDPYAVPPAGLMTTSALAMIACARLSSWLGVCRLLGNKLLTSVTSGPGVTMQLKFVCLLTGIPVPPFPPLFTFVESSTSQTPLSRTGGIHIQ